MFYDAFNTLHWYYNIKSITNVTNIDCFFHPNTSINFGNGGHL